MPRKIVAALRRGQTLRNRPTASRTAPAVLVCLSACALSAACSETPATTQPGGAAGGALQGIAPAATPPSSASPMPGEAPVDGMLPGMTTAPPDHDFPDGSNGSGGSASGAGGSGGASSGGASSGGASSGSGGTGPAPISADAGANPILDAGVPSDSEVPITSVPPHLPNASSSHPIDELYTLEKYLHVPEYDIHIFGARNVHDWTVRGAATMAFEMVRNILAAEDRAAFQNHHVFVITHDDPDVPFGREGHKNTGNAAYTVITQDLICATATGTLRPDNPPAWRAWDTPVHEFGHAIELALGLRQASVEAFSQLNNYREAVRSEYFAWTSQAWFDSEIRRPDGFRANLGDIQRAYFATIFDQESVWRPTCDGRPDPDPPAETPEPAPTASEL